jgi:biopolymer transport protein ExbD
VINFKSASMDLTLRLPVVGSARPVDHQGEVDLLILNINDKGDLNVYGSKRNIEEYVAGEAQASLLSARRKNAKIQAGDELPTTVVIRADRSTPFYLLNRVIKACQQQGFRSFALKAMTKEQT